MSSANNKECVFITRSNRHTSMWYDMSTAHSLLSHNISVFYSLRKKNSICSLVFRSRALALVLVLALCAMCKVVLFIQPVNSPDAMEPMISNNFQIFQMRNRMTSFAYRPSHIIYVLFIEIESIESESVFLFARVSLAFVYPFCVTAKLLLYKFLYFSFSNVGCLHAAYTFRALFNLE